jgi:hypothetical protein
MAGNISFTVWASGFDKVVLITNQKMVDSVAIDREGPVQTVVLRDPSHYDMLGNLEYTMVAYVDDKAVVRSMRHRQLMPHMDDYLKVTVVR